MLQSNSISMQGDSAERVSHLRRCQLLRCCLCQLGSYLFKLQPFSTLVHRMGESRLQGLQHCCGKISMRPQDKLKWPPWFNTPEEDGCNNVDLSHSWGSWKKWCAQAAVTRSPFLHNSAVIGRISKFETHCTTAFTVQVLQTPASPYLNTDISCQSTKDCQNNHNSQGVLDYMF